MKTKNLALWGLCIAFAFYACKKEDDTKEEPAPQPYLVGTWKLKAQTATIDLGGVDTTLDMYADQEPCMKDNLLTFNADHSITYNSGTSRCDPNELAVFSYGSWALLNNNTKLKIESIDTTTSEILIMTSSELKLSEKGTVGGTSYVLKSSYAKQ